MVKRLSWGAIAILFLVALVVRLSTFFPSVIDHDESTYLCIAHFWQQGYIPFVDYIDIKPLGIYSIFLVFLKICDGAIWSGRLAAVVSISISAFYFARIIHVLFKENENRNFLAWSGALLFIAAISIHKWTWSPNTEHFFICPIIVSFYCLISKPKLINLILAGFLLGLGFIIKYHVLFDAAAFAFIYLFVIHRFLSFRLKFSRLIVAGVFFTLPFIFCAIYYWSIGAIEAFWHVTYEIPSRYSSEFSISESASAIGEFLIAFLPLTLLIAWVSITKKVDNWDKDLVRISLIWLSLSTTAVLITGKLFLHYHIQSIPAFCLLTVVMIAHMQKPESRYRWIKILIPLLLIACIINQLSTLKPWQKDVEKKLVQWINNNAEGHRSLFTTDRTILYFATDNPPLSKYVHASLLRKKDLMHAYNINPEKEYGAIFNKEPDLCIIRSNDDQFKQYLADYVPKAEIDGFTIWERKKN